MNRTITMLTMSVLAVGLASCGDDKPGNSGFVTEAAAACAPLVSAVAGVNPASIDTIAQSAKQIADAIGSASGTFIRLTAPDDAARQAVKGFVAKLAEEGVVVGQLQAAANANDPGTVFGKIKALNDTIREADALATAFGVDGCRQRGVLGGDDTGSTAVTNPGTAPVGTTPAATTPPAAAVTTPPAGSAAPVNPGTAAPAAGTLFPPVPGGETAGPALTLPPQSQALAGARRFEDLPPQMTPRGPYTFTFPSLEDFDGFLTALNATPVMQAASGTFGAVSIRDAANVEYAQVGAFALDAPLPAGSIQAWLEKIADPGTISPITIATVPGLHLTINNSPVFVVGNENTGMYIFVADSDANLNRGTTDFFQSL